MMNKSNPYNASIGSFTVADQPETERAAFVRRTYTHLAGSILIFGLLCTLIIQSGLGKTIHDTLLGSQFSWLIVLGAFMGVSYVANKWALSAVSSSTQYMGLGLFIVAEAVIFTPLLYIASTYVGTGVIIQAGFLTGILFLGLTLIVATTKKDFSFLGGMLKVGFLVALGIIVAGILFGFNLGLAFSGAMILLASGQILYETSKIQHHYNPNQHVAAALGLFASVALLFWYILQILMSLTSRD